MTGQRSVWMHREKVTCVHCSINRWALFLREKHPLQLLHTKKGGGLIFDGGTIFGRLWYVHMQWFWNTSLSCTCFSLIPRPVWKVGEKGSYLLFVHALNFPIFREFQIILCYLRVLWHQVRVFCRDNGYLYSRPGFCCVVLLPVTLRRSDGTKIHTFMLAAFGFWQVIIHVTKL